MSEAKSDKLRSARKRLASVSPATPRNPAWWEASEVLPGLGSLGRPWSCYTRKVRARWAAVTCWGAATGIALGGAFACDMSIPAAAPVPPVAPAPPAASSDAADASVVPQAPQISAARIQELAAFVSEMRGRSLREPLPKVLLVPPEDIHEEADDMAALADQASRVRMRAETL